MCWQTLKIKFVIFYFKILFDCYYLNTGVKHFLMCVNAPLCIFNLYFLSKCCEYFTLLIIFGAKLYYYFVVHKKSRKFLLGSVAF